MTENQRRLLRELLEQKLAEIDDSLEHPMSASDYGWLLEQRNDYEAILERLNNG